MSWQLYPLFNFYVISVVSANYVQSFYLINNNNLPLIEGAIISNIVFQSRAPTVVVRGEAEVLHVSVELPAGGAHLPLLEEAEADAPHQVRAHRVLGDQLRAAELGRGCSHGK